MDPSQFEATEPHLDRIADELDSALLSPELQKVRAALAELGKCLGERYSVTLTCLVEVFDREEERTLPRRATGLSTSGGAEPHPVSGDSTPTGTWWAARSGWCRTTAARSAGGRGTSSG